MPQRTRAGAFRARFGLVQNLFNQHYYSAGTFFNKGGFNNSTPGGDNLFAFNDPRTFLPGMPLAIYGGIRARSEDAQQLQLKIGRDTTEGAEGGRAAHRRIAPRDGQAV
jgi:hypothetical protein